MRTEEFHSGPEAHGGVFGTPHWSVVLAAGQQQSPQAAEALDQLCRTYWYPLYVYTRRRGYPPEDAQDLTQAFFAHLLSREFLTNVGPEKGKFRSFLLTCLKHFLTDEWKKAHTARRGGAAGPVSLDWEQAEARYRSETRNEASAEALYERRWALDLLDHVLNQLRDAAVASGNGAVFDQLQSCLLGEQPTESYAQLGTRLGLSETAVKVRVHRLRQQYRDLLREQIAQTVSAPAEIEEEVRYLFQVVCR